jgi:hypothetical protein
VDGAVRGDDRAGGAVDLVRPTAVRIECQEGVRKRDIAAGLRHRVRPDVLVRHPEDAGEERRPLGADRHLDVVGNPRERRREDRWNVDPDVAAIRAVDVATLRCHLARGLDGLVPAGTRRAEPVEWWGTLRVLGAGERRGIGDVLLRSAVEQVLAHVEDERRDGQDQDDRTGEQDEDLAALVAAPVSG